MGLNSKTKSKSKTKSQSKSQFKFKALGLVEVLIAIAVTGILMTASITVATRALMLIRGNELVDLASSILVRSLEISRSPANFNFSDQVNQGSSANFKLSSDPTTQQYSLMPAPNGPEITDCTSSTQANYLVEIGLRGSNELAANVICNQIVITDVTVSANTASRVFQVKSVVVYEYLGNISKQELISYSTEFIPV